MTEEQFERWLLPRGWAWVRFEEAANIAQNLVAPSKVLDLPHIAPNHIGSGNRQLLPYSTVRADTVISPKQRFYPGQILFTKIRPYLLKSVLVDFEGVCSADMYPLWAKETAEPKYLLYWLTSPEFRDEIALEQGRTVLPKINQLALNRSMVALPPLPEQRRIVAKIDSLSVKSRRAREHLDHVPRLIEKYKQSVLATVFSGAANQNGLVPLSEVIASTFYGPRVSKDAYDSDGVVTLRTTDFDDDGNIKLKSPPAVRVSEIEFAKWGLVDGDILVTRTGSIGKCAQYGDAIGPALPSAYLIRVRLLLERVRPRYVLLFLLSETGQAQLGLGITAVTQPNINAGVIERLRLPIPDLDTQDRAIRLIDKALAWIDRLASKATSARKLIDHLDDAILAKAFRGQLVPQDPNDEPASGLLERIRAEREAKSSTKRPTLKKKK
jgi:type I restriction enzyme, S subunit